MGEPLKEALTHPDTDMECVLHLLTVTLTVVEWEPEGEPVLDAVEERHSVAVAQPLAAGEAVGLLEMDAHALTERVPVVHLLMLPLPVVEPEALEHALADGHALTDRVPVLHLLMLTVPVVEPEALGHALTEPVPVLCWLALTLPVVEGEALRHRVALGEREGWGEEEIVPLPLGEAVEDVEALRRWLTVCEPEGKAVCEPDGRAVCEPEGKAEVEADRLAEGLPLWESKRGEGVLSGLSLCACSW